MLHFHTLEFVPIQPAIGILQGLAGVVKDALGSSYLALALLSVLGRLTERSLALEFLDLDIPDRSGPYAVLSQAVRPPKDTVSGGKRSKLT